MGILADITQNLTTTASLSVAPFSFIDLRFIFAATYVLGLGGLLVLTFVVIFIDSYHKDD